MHILFILYNVSKNMVVGSDISVPFSKEDPLLSRPYCGNISPNFFLRGYLFLYIMLVCDADFSVMLP